MIDIEQNLIDSMLEEGDVVFSKLLDDYPILDDDDVRQSTILLSLMTNCISRLYIQGWTETELVNEVFNWCENARRWQQQRGDEE